MTESRPDRAGLLERVQRGDDDAAHTLVRELYPLVMKVVRAHLPRRLDEEDLAQVIFASLFAHLDQYSGAVPLEHWVSRVAVNTCYNALRAEQRRPELRHADLSEGEAEVLERVLSVDGAADPAEQVAARDLAHKLLERLEPPDRLLLSLLDLEGRSVAEVRQVTGWNSSRIKVRAFRARRKLRQQLEKLMETRLARPSLPGPDPGGGLPRGRLQRERQNQA
jgi:RNA polymerase sigma-70 factor (ECF subfamily)